MLGNRTANASAVAYDFVDLLLRALEARGLQYRVVARVVNNDLEFPMYTGIGPLPFDDVRYTDQDVILARAGLPVGNPVAQLGCRRSAYRGRRAAASPARLDCRGCKLVWSNRSVRQHAPRGAELPPHPGSAGPRADRLVAGIAASGRHGGRFQFG